MQRFYMYCLLMALSAIFLREMEIKIGTENEKSDSTRTLLFVSYAYILLELRCASSRFLH